MLPELFQEEKAVSPASATPSGRTPLSRVAVKPAKSKMAHTSKEHKKTVGHQVKEMYYMHLFGAISRLHGPTLLGAIPHDNGEREKKHLL